MVVKKLGQPVPLSYFMSEVKRARLQPTQTNIPGRFSLFRGLVPGGSVPSSRSTLNCVGSRRLRHSSFESLSGSEGKGNLVPSAKSAFQFFCRFSISFMEDGWAAFMRPSNTVQIPGAKKNFNDSRRVIALSLHLPEWGSEGLSHRY